MRKTILFLALNLFVLLATCGQESLTVDKRFENIIGIGKITLSSQDYGKLHDFLSKALEKDMNNNESDLFVSQELLDFSYDSSVFLYQYFDWKEPSGHIEDFVEQELVDKYNDTVKYISPLWVDNELPDSLVDIQYASISLIGKYLYDRGYSLINIDCDCDCYRLVLIPNRDTEKIRKFASNLSCEFEPHTKKW